MKIKVNRTVDKTRLNDKELSISIMADGHTTIFSRLLLSSDFFLSAISYQRLNKNIVHHLSLHPGHLALCPAESLRANKCRRGGV